MRWIVLGCCLLSLGRSNSVSEISGREKTPQPMVTLAVSPVLMVSSASNSEMAQGLPFREELVARLSMFENVRVLSRSRNFSLLIEEGIRSLKGNGEEKSHQNFIPADYVILVYAIQTLGQNTNGDVVLSVYEVGPKNTEIYHERLEDLPWDPLAMAGRVAEELRSILRLRISDPAPKDEADVQERPLQEKKVYAVLPPRSFGVDPKVHTVFEPLILSQIEQNLLDEGDVNSLVDRSRILDVLREHNMTSAQIGSETVHASLARIIGAEEILVPNLLVHRGQGTRMDMSLSMMGVDATSGVVTRSHRMHISDDILDLPETVAELMKGFLSKPLAIFPDAKSENPQALHNEFSLYSEWIVGFRRQVRNVWDLHWVLAIEMLESAIYLSTANSQSDLFGLLERSIPIIFDEPEVLSPYEVFRPHYSEAMQRHFYDIVETAVETRTASAAPEIRTRGGIALTNAAIHANLPEAAEDAILKVPPTHAQFPLLHARISLLTRDSAGADRWLDQVDNPGRDVLRLRAISQFQQNPGSRAEYEWLKKRFEGRQRLHHSEADRRTLFLANQYESPERRLEIVDRHLTRWASGGDLALYTRAKAFVDLGETSKARPRLQVLAAKRQLDSMLPSERQFLQSDIRRMLEEIGSEEDQVKAVRYVDVNPPPEGLKYYIQPMGRFDSKELAAAAKRIRDFSGLEVVVREAWDLPDVEAIYSRKTRQYDSETLRLWALRRGPIPEDAVLMAYVLGEDIHANNGWIYASTMRNSAFSIVSTFRWKAQVRPRTPEAVGHALAKSLLSNIQSSFRAYLRPHRIEALIGTRNWPNHAGTIQFSRGTSSEVVQAPFTLCEDTAKLVEAVDWNQFMDFVRRGRETFYLNNNISFP